VKTKLVKEKSLAKPYITSDIKAMIREKNRLQRKYAKHPVTFAESFKKLRNKLTLTIRKAKAEYYKNKFEQSSGDSKKTWNIINNILSRSKNNRPLSMMINGHESSDSTEIANSFNSYFANIAKTC